MLLRALVLATYFLPARKRSDFLYFRAGIRGDGVDVRRREVGRPKRSRATYIRSGRVNVKGRSANGSRKTKGAGCGGSIPFLTLGAGVLFSVTLVPGVRIRIPINGY